MKLCILISAFCLLTSVGLGSDVGVDTIVSPAGTIDSGQAVLPRCAVHAYTGSGPVSVHFEIPDAGYHDSLTLPPLPPGLVDTVQFASWIPRSRDSMTGIAWIECDGDTYPQNDTFVQRFLVQIRDIAVTQIIQPAPDTVFDSGVIFYPQCRVWNYGNISLNFDVRFRIGEYQSTRNLNLIAGGATVVTAPDPYTAVPGIWACIDSALVDGDLHPENDIKVDTFTVRGRVRESLWVRIEMPDTVDTTEFWIRSRAGNPGVSEASFWVFFGIYDSAGTIELRAESSQVLLSPGDSTVLDFGPVRLNPGAYLAVVSVRIEPGGRVYADSEYFWVVPGTGIEESHMPQATSYKPQPTILSGASGVERLTSCVVFDATGRRVRDPKPGVYFVVSPPPDPLPQGERENGAVSVRKVIVQR